MGAGFRRRREAVCASARGRDLRSGAGEGCYEPGAGLKGKLYARPRCRRKRGERKRGAGLIAARHRRPVARMSHGGVRARMAGGSKRAARSQPRGKLRYALFTMIALLRIAAATAIAALAAGAKAEPGGFYAQDASVIWDKIAGAPSSKVIELISPDGESRVAAHTDPDKGVALDISGRMGSHHVDIGAGVGSELLWSPDSKTFAVTTSDDGANGHYRTIVVGSGADGLIVRDLSPLIEKAFGHPVKCGWPELPNVGAVRWNTPATLVVVAEIVAHSNCDSFGTFRAYIVDWRHMRIVSSFDQIAAKQSFWPSLGAELRSSPDECLRSPQACWVSTNHPREAVRP